MLLRGGLEEAGKLRINKNPAKHPASEWPSMNGQWYFFGSIATFNVYLGLKLNFIPPPHMQLSRAKECPLICLEVTICRLPFPESGEPSPFPPNQVTPQRTMGETPQGPWQPFARHREKSVIVYWYQSTYLNQIRFGILFEPKFWSTK